MISTRALVRVAIGLTLAACAIAVFAADHLMGVDANAAGSREPRAHSPRALAEPPARAFVAACPSSSRSLGPSSQTARDAPDEFLFCARRLGFRAATPPVEPR
jgi:hypothetical protein